MTDEEVGEPFGTVYKLGVVYHEIQSYASYHAVVLCILLLLLWLLLLIIIIWGYLVF